jgi:hypothetical protein
VALFGSRLFGERPLGGTKRTSLVVRLESGMRTKTDVGAFYAMLLGPFVSSDNHDILAI